MNNTLIDRLRASWYNLNERERRMLSMLGGVVLVLLLLLPPLMLSLSNNELQTENDELRTVLDQLSKQRGRLMQLAQERKSAEARYLNKTPPLGSFMEAEAKKQGLTLQEVTDQPEKTVGRYQRRSVSVSLPQTGLTPVIQLLSSIVQSGHPVAVQEIQLDHYQPGDQYNVKLGILTYDKLSSAGEDDKDKTKAGGSDG
jgi:type II secretory pathway component PulM